MLEFRYRFGRGLAASRTPRDVVKVGRDAVQWGVFRARAARPLLKDPNALFLAPWLSQNFGVRAVVLIRHPAAFASSLLKLGWTFDFTNLLQQPELLEDHLHEFESQMALLTRIDTGVLEQAILLWRVLHRVISNYRKDHPDWIFVRHEDLSRDATEQFEMLCVRLSIPFDDRVRKRVRDYSSADNPSDATAQTIPVNRGRSLRRNSELNASNWKRRLTAEQVGNIRRGVEDVASEFYGDQDW